MLVSINRLKQHFNLTTLLELFNIERILDRIKHFTFFLGDTPIEIVKEDGVLWFMRPVMGGHWSRTNLTESTLTVVKVLKAQLHKLMGIKSKTNEEQPKEKTKSNASLYAFLTLTASVVGWNMYKSFKK